MLRLTGILLVFSLFALNGCKKDDINDDKKEVVEPGGDSENVDKTLSEILPGNWTYANVWQTDGKNYQNGTITTTFEATSKNLNGSLSFGENSVQSDVSFVYVLATTADGEVTTKEFLTEIGPSGTWNEVEENLVITDSFGEDVTWIVESMTDTEIIFKSFFQSEGTNYRTEYMNWFKIVK